MFKKLTIIDLLTILGAISLIVFTGFHLFIHNIFQASDFAEGFMMLVFGKGAHIGANIADKYFNSPEAPEQDK